MSRVKIMAMETIAFQSNHFFKDITDIVNKIRKINLSEPNVKFYNSKEISELIKCIKDYTGIKITLQNSWIHAGIFIPKVNKNHILFQNFDFDEWQKEEDVAKLLNEKNNFSTKGCVDILKAKVSGFYSEVDNIFVVNRQTLFNDRNLTDQEIAAVVLHEIGHVFTTFEYVNRNISTNQCLTILNKSLENNLSLEKREDIFCKINDLAYIDKLTKEKIIKAKSKQEIAILLIGKESEKCKSELGIDVYDFNSSEYLADMFVNRCCAGKDLVTALDKLFSNSNNNNNTPLQGIWVAGGITALFCLGMPATALFVTMVSILTVSLQSNQHVYDNDFSRFKRIKQDNIERLKNIKISDLEKEDLLNQNKAIDLILDTRNENKDLWETLAYWFRPGYKKEKDFEILQKQLESLSSNDLFEKTARLSLIK